MNLISVKIDYDELKFLIRAEVKEAMDEYIGLLPTRDEFYTMMDKVMKELQSIREEQIFMRHDLKRVKAKVRKIEKKTQ